MWFPTPLAAPVANPEPPSNAPGVAEEQPTTPNNQAIRAWQAGRGLGTGGVCTCVWVSMGACMGWSRSTADESQAGDQVPISMYPQAISGSPTVNARVPGLRPGFARGWVSNAPVVGVRTILALRLRDGYVPSGHPRPADARFFPLALRGGAGRRLPRSNRSRRHVVDADNRHVAPIHHRGTNGVGRHGLRAGGRPPPMTALAYST